MFSNFSRRQTLKLIRVVGIGTVAAGSVAFFSNFLASKAQAQKASNFVYKGRRYRIQTNQNPKRVVSRNHTLDNSEELFIDDKQIQIFRNDNNQKYMTPLLFGDYSSPQEVAKTLIDLRIKFPSGEVQVDPNVD